jgi:hypothetical protein
MNKQLRLVCVGLSTLAIVHCTSFAQPAQKNSAANPTAISSEKIAKGCEDEWRANQKVLMKGQTLLHQNKFLAAKALLGSA